MLQQKNGTTDQVTRVVVHCSASKPKAAARETIADIDKMHRERGWDMVGYHMFIRRDGTVEFGRPFGQVPAQVKGANRGSIGVCLAGGVDEEGEPVPGGGYSTQQWMSLERVLKALCILYPDAKCLGHRDHVGVKKACPAFSVADRFRHVKGIRV